MNLRPPGPQPGALPDCATPRDGHSVTRESVWDWCEHVFVSEVSEEDPLRCSRCGETKPAHEFAWRRRRKLQRDTYCRGCRAAYGKKHYEANKQKYVEQAAARKRRVAVERWMYLLEHFRQHPCADCGETDPIVLEFDHTGDDKAFNISEGLISRPWPVILAEIAKCDVVCANCHRRRTAGRGGHTRAAVAQLVERKPSKLQVASSNLVRRFEDPEEPDAPSD